LAAVSGALFSFSARAAQLGEDCSLTDGTAPTSGKRRPKDPAATIPLRDGDEGWTVPALASAFKMSERSFRDRFVKPGLLPVSRLGGVDFASITAARNLVSDMIAGGADPGPRGSRRRRRRCTPT
jgi:hypothetical protein